MKLFKTEFGYLLEGEYIAKRFHHDDLINDMINLIVDYYDEMKKYGMASEKKQVKDLIVKYVKIHPESTEALGRMLATRATNDVESLENFYDELDEIGAFDDQDDEYYSQADYGVDESEEVDEALKRKTIVRQGKKIKVKRSTRAGYTRRGGKEVRMGAKEKRNRARAQRKAARKRRSKKAQSIRKRRRSMNKRRNISK